jgi:hypothetical protein
MLTVAAAPGTSAPVLALAIFTVCVALFPGATIRPSELTIRGLEPTVIVIPTQPL